MAGSTTGSYGPGSEPRTEAGRRLRDDRDVETSGLAEHPHPEYVEACWFCDAIRAIEDEARDAALLDSAARVLSFCLDHGINPTEFIRAVRGEASNEEVTDGR